VAEISDQEHGSSMSLHHSEDVSGQQHWLKTYQVRWGSAIAVAAVWMALFLGLSFSRADDFLESKFTDVLHFRLRDFAGQTPMQDPRLKIFAIDDQTFGLLGTPMPSMAVWADILDAITVNKPKMVFIDAMFSASSDDVTKKTAEMIKVVKNSNVPIITGAFVSPSEIRFKTPLVTDGQKYQLAHYLQNVSDRDGVRAFIPKWEDRSTWFAYGPASKFSGLLNNAYHFQLFSENRVEPFLWLGDGRVIPHMSLLAAETLSVQRDSLKVNGRGVAMDRQGSIPVNFLPRSSWKIYSMDGLIRSAQRGYAAPNVMEGDIVLILPLYFTGNVDLRPSPYGWIPGGLYMAAMINSVLTGQWLQPVLMHESLLVLLTLMSVLSAMTLGNVRHWIAWALCSAAVVVISECAFIYVGVKIPYFFPLACASFAGAHVFILQVRSGERKTAALRAALDGAVSPTQLERMIKQTDTLNFEPRERVVTLMFVDVVGFSLSSENMLPRLAFENLKNILGQITAKVHQYGGVIDKTLGDGVLCYFGYKLESDETETDHPERALRCAIAIQEQSLADSLRCAEQGLPIYPLRIGINTASCYIGDIGSGRRIEFTVVGNGVNFAKRLEAACDTYAVMIGSTTYDLIKGLDINSNRFTRKALKIKHHAELMDAFEVDPFAGRSADKAKAIESFRNSARIQRLNERFIVRDVESIKVNTDHGDGRLLNFSGSGISLLLKEALARGMSLDLRFESRNPGLKAALCHEGLETLAAEVRWTYVSSTGVVHGIMFTGLSSEQMLSFSRLVAEYAQIHKTESEGDVDDEIRLSVG
jgi:class 3 adenylate cyclase/CHASE2 domain-containing sensor protein